MHGLRHPVLPSGMPAGQPDSRLERSRLPRSLGAGDRAAARHEQFSRVHRPPLSRAVRRVVRARHQRRPGHDQVDRSLDHREGVRRRMGDGEAAARAHGQDGRRHRIGPGRSGRGRSAEPRGPFRDGLREIRSHRRPAALRHSRVQDGEEVPEPPAVADGAGRRATSARA